MTVCTARQLSGCIRAIARAMLNPLSWQNQVRLWKVGIREVFDHVPATAVYNILRIPETLHECIEDIAGILYVVVLLRHRVTEP